jgi:DNA-binding transcriptional ArsR family regulator
MGRLLPGGGSDTTPDAGPRVIGLEGEQADDLLAAMSSETARELLSVLHTEPAAPSELADSVGTSLQNTQYHLEQLEEAGAVEVVDTVYSEKGREMDLYAPADQPLVVVAGGTDKTASLRSAIGTLVSGLAIIGLLAVLVQSLAGQEPVDTADDAMTMTAEEATPVAGGGAGFDVLGVLTEPGVLFFLGGSAALLVAGAVWYVRR